MVALKVYKLDTDTESPDYVEIVSGPTEDTTISVSALNYALNMNVPDGTYTV